MHLGNSFLTFLKNYTVPAAGARGGAGAQGVFFLVMAEA